MSLNRRILLIGKLHIGVSIFLLISLLFFSCRNDHTAPAPYAAQYAVHCGSCHIAPKPTNIPRTIWEDHVLPEMAARMGHRYGGYDPFRFRSQDEMVQINLGNTYPEQQLIDYETWWSIHDYITSLAPYAIPVDTTRKNRNKNLTQFSIKTIDIPELTVPVITNIQFDTIKHLFNIGDATGSLYQWSKSNTTNVVEKLNSAVSSYNQKQNELYITEIGILNPSEISAGLVTRNSSGIIDTVGKKLHRPVFTEIVDLNDDGVDELLVCEFGDLTGQLSLFEKKESGYVKTSLYPKPGAIKLEIYDMNQDGKKDIIAQFSQGDEGIFIFYQKNNMTFSSEQVIRLPPEYGSSWFELIDYDTDGDLDIVLANGDNADYSIFLKPYHGIRLFLNDGTNVFTQEWFHPLYGATKVLADDYDADGDIDFAVTAFFNDTKNSPEEGFVYLENLSSKQFKFQPYTVQGDFTNGWLTMAKGDYDSDGDIDIMLGSFNVKGLRKKNSIFESKEKNPIKLLMLRNEERNR